MSALPSLLRANEAFAASFARGALEAPPTVGVLLLTCLDARVDPGRILGLDLGDAHVIRNAGGRVTDDAIRSATISSWMLGTREFVVLHHTDCGMTKFTDAELQTRIRQATGVDVSDRPYLSFSDAEVALREDVSRLRAVQTFPEGVTVTGWSYDVRTGRVTTVVPSM